MPRRLALLVFLLLVSGCATSNPHCHGGHFVCEHKGEGGSFATETAPYKASYALYRWKTPPQGQPAPHTWVPEQEVEEIYVRGLDRGDKVGFEKGEKGELYAVAGCEKIALEPGRYCWHITTGSEMHGFRLAVHQCCETVRECVTAIIALPMGIILLLFFLPFILLLAPFMILLGCLVLLG